MVSLMRLSPLVVLGLVSVVSLTGCAFSSAPPLYQLHTNAATPLPEASQGAVLLVGPISVADYLQREQLVQRQADGTLVVEEEARWAGDFQQNVAQLIMRQLASDLGNSHLVLYPDHGGLKPAFQLCLEITRLDSGPEQPAVLEAQWRLLDSQGHLQGSRLVRLQGNHDGSLSSQVQAQSRLLSQLSEQLARASQPTLVQYEDARLRAQRQAKEQAALAGSRKKERMSKVPKPLPTRTQTGVFRF